MGVDNVGGLNDVENQSYKYQLIHLNRYKVHFNIGFILFQRTAWCSKVRWKEDSAKESALNSKQYMIQLYRSIEKMTFERPHDLKINTTH